MKLYNQYIDGVMSGEIIASELVKKAVMRHINDVQKSSDPNYPYMFKEDYADRIIQFMGLMKLTGGAYRGKRWEVQPFQAFYLAMVYGWVKKEADEDGRHMRRFKTVYWSTARKSAKSEKSGGEEVWHLFMDGEGSPQIVNVATTRAQAAYVYDAASYMTNQGMKDYASLSKLGKITQYHIRNVDNGGYITCLTSDHKTNDGGNIHFASIDEYHAHDDDSMVKVVETGMGMRDQPLLKITTTAGFNKEGPDYKFRELCTKILNGEIQNDSIFCMIYSLDDGDDWKDEKNWYKANPMLGITPKLEFMRDQFQKAITEGGETEVQFKTKNLNIYTDAAKVWISDEKYMSLANNKASEELEGLYCYLGVDLAAIVDLTAVTAFFPEQEGLDKPYYKTMYFCPESKFEKIRTDGVVYSEFLKGGWVKKTDGNVIDKDQILEYIQGLAKKVEIRMIGYDPYKAVEIIPELQNMGFECGQVRQGTLTMSPAVEYWEKLMLSDAIEHDGSPVTRWQMGNVEMKRDDNDNRKIIKSSGKIEKKVDGPVSILNAIVTYLASVQGSNKEGEVGEDEMAAFLKSTNQY